MEAEREKEVSSLQVQSSQGAPPAVVLDSDDEEDAMRSRTRSLHIAPRKNGIERGSRATQGWGLASSLSWARPRVHSRLLHCPFCLSAAGSTPPSPLRPAITFCAHVHTAFKHACGRALCASSVIGAIMF